MTACSLRRDQESRVVFGLSKSHVWDDHVGAMKKLVSVVKAADERFGRGVLGYVVDTQVCPYSFGPKILIKGLGLSPEDMAFLAEGRLWLDISVIAADRNDLKRTDDEG